MILSTTFTLDGHPVKNYLGVVSAETIIGANAVIGISINYTTVGASGSMLMVTCTGTAVVV